MIISTVTELDQLLPPNVSSRTERLFTLFEQTERSLLIPVLGNALYDKVQQSYSEIVSGTATFADGSPVTGPDELCTSGSSSSLTPMQQLIRLLQVPLVYLTLSNNATLLSVSLNDSGMNLVSAEGYDAVRREDREAFARDCYMNSQKGMEQVLLFLERDAQSSQPSFLTLWRQSPGFYIHNELLLRTAEEFGRYTYIADSRETYLQLIPSIRNVQENRLRPELGDMLMNALIQFSVFGPQPRPESVTLPDTPQPMPQDAMPVSTIQAEDSFIDDLRPYLPYTRASSTTPGELHKLRVWNKALSLIRLSLSCYVESESKRLRRGDSSLNDAMSALQRLRQHLADNSSSFQGVIEQSPFYCPPVPDEKQPSSHCPDGGFVHDPFGSFYN